jgi:uncharacterized protein
MWSTPRSRKIAACLQMDAAIPACGIAVMAKASRPGITKTRLVPPTSFEEAAAFNTAFLLDVADNIAAAGRVIASFGGTIDAYIAFGPTGTEEFFRRILPTVRLIEASQTDFGDCLFTATKALLAHGHASAVVLNSDSPTLPPALLVETARVLACPGDRAVLGPSTDGGYYLLGLKAPHRRLFEEVSWSSERVARQTLQRAAEIALDVHILPAWYDVDDAASLRMLKAELCDGFAIRGGGLAPHRAPHTRKLLAKLMAQTDLLQRLGIADIQRAAE